MLPKVDKNKKQFPQGQFPDKKPDPLSDKKSLKKKRRLILFSLLITVGLSLIFWTYRSVKTLLNKDQPISFKINLPSPNFNFNNKVKDKSKDFNKEMEKILSSTSNDLALYITDNSPDKVFIWQKNQQSIFTKKDLASIKNEINSLQPSSKNSLNLDLPQGLTFQEINDSNQYFLQINLPGRKLLILISSNQPQNFPSLIQSVYWNYIESLN
jgi:hypothetical protein